MIEIDKYNLKKTDFGNGSLEIVAYHQAQLRLLGTSGHKGGANECSVISDKAQEKRTQKQIYSIKRRIRGYALANSFKWFATLTLDPKKMNSLDYSLAKMTLLKWCRSTRDKYGKFDYLIVPEFHQSGAVHFHALLGELAADFVEARHPKTGKVIQRNKRQVYNLIDWKYGFSDCELIDDPERTASYITKYITKQLLTNKEMFRKKRYFNSKGLKKPKVSFELKEDKGLREFVPNYGIIETDDKGNNFIDKAIYKLEQNPETGELSQTNNDYLLKAKSPDRYQDLNN